MIAWGSTGRCLAALALGLVGTIAAAGDSGWPLHGLTPAEDRGSPLTQITPDNIGELGLAWYVETGEVFGHEATPIVVNGVIYFTTPWSKVIAVDARTGTKRWTYDPQVPKQYAYWACCDVVNRGPAVHGNRVFVAALDGRLIALDRENGTVRWEVSTVDSKRPYTITGAPRVVDDLVVIGNSGAEYGVRGYVTAYDARDGKQRWRFYTTPGDPSRPQEGAHLDAALPTWTGEMWWKTGGGGTVWDSMAFDPTLDLLYIGTGNGSPWSRYVRSPGGGDNLYLSSIVAVEAKTGRMRWYYQTTPGDNWDYTATQHIVLADLPLNGAVRKVLMQAPKNGFFYVLDRVTGELLSANAFTKVTWASHVDLKTGRPVEQSERAYDKGLKNIFPSSVGGHSWPPMSYNKRTGLVYIPTFTQSEVYELKPGFAYDADHMNLGTRTVYWVAPPERLAEAERPPPPEMVLIAWNPATGREVWRRNNGPGGVLSTDAGLVFEGNADGELKAFSADDGRELWSFQTQRGVIAPPITYQLDGVQYVALLAGYGGALGFGTPSTKVDNRASGRLLVFQLGGKATLPEVVPREYRVTLRQPSASAAEIATGEELYADHCSRCHGPIGVIGHSIPNLAYMSTAREDTFESIVLGGALQPLGMPRFSHAIESEQAKLILEFVRSAARALR